MTSAWTLRCCAALLLAVPGLAAAAPPKGKVAAKPAAKAVKISPLTCAAPIGRLDSGKALERRFGDNATASTRPDERGIQVFKVTLYPDEPARRIEVLYPDAAMRVPLGIRIDRVASTWSVGGLRVGESLAAAVSRNGGPFALRGFAPGDGGRVTDWKGGKLGAALPGGCTVGLRLIAPLPEEVAAAANGAERTLRSDQAEVLAAQPIIAELSLTWPATPPATKPRKRK